ncbi:MAG: chloride channel protein, partial [Halioglobus sp.]|nr:chloride channel protein [Halioglobus sp.]
VGMGYDTLDLTLQGELALATLAGIALCKILATAVSCGVGMPIGLIGPNLLIGACIGAMFGTLAVTVLPDLALDPTLYIVIGMGAAMGAVLNAPLAALLAVVELTQTINIGMPAMLAIVAANLTNSGLFGQDSAHRSVLRQLKRLVPDDPINQLLHSANVTRTMDTRVVRVPSVLAEQDLEPLLESTPAWCVVTRADEDLYLVDGAELIACLSQMPLDEQDADVTETAIRRWTIAPVPIQASLRQAMDTMRDQTAEAVCICERSRSSGKNILHGIITKEAIEKFTLSSLG